MTKWTGFIRWQTGFMRKRTGLISKRIKPVRRRIKPVPLVVFSLNSPLVLLICPFLLVFSCPKRDNSTIIMSIYCLFFHIEEVNYPFKAISKLSKLFLRDDISYLLLCFQNSPDYTRYLEYLILFKFDCLQ